MKNVKNANYCQIDHSIKNISQIKGVFILPSAEAWKKFRWTRKYFEKKPKEGYFVWVKKEINFPFTTCITIASSKVRQNLNNLLVIEKDIKVKANLLCNSARKHLRGFHKAEGKILLKEKASLEYNHVHQWGSKDIVNSEYEFILEEGSRLVYNYKNLLPPKVLNIKTTIYNANESSSNLNFVASGIRNSKISIKDKVFLEGENSQGNIKLRLVGKDRSQIATVSSIVASAPGKGHLDCQGLLTSKNAKISLTPELICQNKSAQITHEASIGKIAEEELSYLRMRGLKEEEAINLITNGFLNLW